MNPISLGFDYGSDSARVVAVDCFTGEILLESVEVYIRWKKGMYCDLQKQIFRHHPQDYIDALQKLCKTIVSRLNKKQLDCIVGIGIDTTGSTPVAVDRNGTPLSLLEEFKDDPDAMFVLWKDHSAVAEAEQITNLAHGGRYPDYTKYVGSVYSAEWYWAKAGHIFNTNERICKYTYSWVELCDWLPGLLTNTSNPDTLKRSRCASGHKLMWHEEFNGIPSPDFFAEINPYLYDVAKNFPKQTYTSDKSVGKLNKNWAEALGLNSDIIVAVGAYDAHMGAVGGGIRNYDFTRVMGTSTCDIMTAPLSDVSMKAIAGICGQVNGSVIPDRIGFEAGQSSFGDAYAWFRQILAWPLEEFEIENKEKYIDKILNRLGEAAKNLPITEKDVVSLDWFNGRRTPFANQRLKSLISGIDLSITAPHIYKSIVEATAFGARAIMETFITNDIPVKRVLGMGGVAKKSSFAMQTLSNILNKQVDIVSSEQCCALGAAIFGAVSAKIYNSVDKAIEVMSSPIEVSYFPQAEHVKTYDSLYKNYTFWGKSMESSI